MDYNRDEIRKKYEDMFEYSLDLIYVCDLNGNFLDANEITLMALGYDREEILNLSFKDLVSGEQLIEALNVVKEIKETGRQLKPGEFKLRTKDGDDLYVQTYAIALRRNGEIYAVLGIATNITERKIAELKLKESEERYRNMVNNLDIGYYNIGMDGIIHYQNPKSKKIAGFDDYNLIGKSSFDFWQNLEEREEYLEELKKNGFIKNFIVHGKKKDGTKIVVMVNAHTINDSKGKPILIEGTLDDVTEKFWLEKKLKDSETKYRLITDNANDLISVIDENFRHEYLNEEVHKKITGYSSEDLIGESPIKNVHPEDTKKTVRTWRAGVISGEGTVEVKYKKKDGTWIWLEIRGKKFTGLNGKPKGIIISRDITKRKIAEQKLKESEEKFRLSYENAANAILWADPKTGLIINCNKAAEILLEKGQEEIIGKHQTTIHPPQKAKYYTEMFKRHIEQKGGINDEATVITASGKIIPVHITGTVTLISGKPIIQGIFQDITKEKEAEQKLKESEKKHRQLFEETPFAIILLNLDGIIIDCNPTTKKLLGYNKEELIGRNYQNASIIHPKYLEITNILYKNFFKGKKVHRVNLEVFRKDNKLIWVQARGSIIRIGDREYMELLLYDISKQKKAEFLIKEQLDKLKELDEIRKNLIIGVSHELKTPLVSVCGGTELLLDQYNGELGNEVKEIINLIGNGGNRLKGLVNRLLDVSRLEENKLKLEKSKSNLSEIIEESIKEMTYAIRRRNLILELKIPQLLYLKIDRMRIQQVINNLLSNAIKNTPPKGKIIIELHKKGNGIILTVKDTGVGLTKKEKELLFTRFGKIERHGQGLEDTDIQGSGIGLFISRELIKLHGGVILVESPGRNKGSTFTVKLPVK